jgi:pilus assembly protein CpaF
MFQIDITDADGKLRQLQVPDDCIVGKGEGCDIRLDSWRVSREHAHLVKTPGGVLLEDLGSYLGVCVNGQRIEAQHGPLAPGDVIGIGAFRLRVNAMAGEPGQPPRQRPIEIPAAAAQPVPAPAASSMASAVHDARRLELEQEFEWRKRIHAILLETMDLRRHDVSRMSDGELRAQASTVIAQIMAEQEGELPAAIDRSLLSKQVLDEAVGLGPLEELLADDSVSEIMVNRYDEIYVERNGRLQHHPLSFTSDRAVLGVIERIVAPLGRRIDESSPMVDARLQDGSRVNAIIAPLALKGATLTIRKFARHKMSAQDLVEKGSLSAAMAQFLRLCVQSRKNIIVSGGTGSGKTTLLNILSNFIPEGERIITVEDAAELKLNHAHLISLEARPANVEGKGLVAIRDLVKNTLRMRPDRIVIGECRGAEALDMLQAMNTGHDGSLTTLHANSPRDGLARLETMVLMAGMDLPLSAIREQVASAVDIVVQQSRFACGSRIITSITEVTGIEGGKFQLQEIFRFANQGYGQPSAGKQGGARVQGYFTGCDLVPAFYEDLRAFGNDLDLAIFAPSDPVSAIE